MTLLGGFLNDRLLARGVPLTRVRKSFAVGGLFVATVLTVGAGYAPGVVAAVTLITLSVGAFSLATAAIQSMAPDVAPRGRISSLVSLQNFGGNVGGSFAPLVTGVLAARTGDFAFPLYVTAAVTLVLGCGGYGWLVGSLAHRLDEKPAPPV